jgi:hypothetical protein
MADFFSMNIGGGEMWRSTSLATASIAVTPGPFIEEVGGTRFLRTVLPPYAAGTAPSLQNPAGTRYWLAFDNDDEGLEQARHHGWDVRKWKAELLLGLEFIGGEIEDIVLPVEFGDAGDLAMPAPNLTENPGQDYAFTTAATTFGGSVTGGGIVIALPPISRAGVFESADDPITNGVLLLNVGVLLGRPRRMFTHGIYCEADIRIQCQFGEVIGGTFFPLEDGDGTTLNTLFTNWRTSSAVTGPQSVGGSVSVEDFDREVYGSAVFDRGQPAPPTYMAATASMVCYWDEEQGARTP